MKNKEKILVSYINQKFSENGLEIDTDFEKKFASCIELEEGYRKIEDETRSVTIKEDTDGKISASSIKLYNIMKVEQFEIQKSLIKTDAVFFDAGLLNTDQIIKMCFTLLDIAYEFYSKLKYTFNDTDAKILAAIYQFTIKEKEFTETGLNTFYSVNSNETLKDGQISRSLHFFTSLKVIKDLGEGKYALRERLIYERN